MKVLRSTLPIIVEIDAEDIYCFHNALYLYKNELKHLKGYDKKTIKLRLKKVNELIQMVDLML